LLRNVLPVISAVVAVLRSCNFAALFLVTFCLLPLANVRSQFTGSSSLSCAHESCRLINYISPFDTVVNSNRPRTNLNETEEWKLQNGRLFHKFTSTSASVSLRCICTNEHTQEQLTYTDRRNNAAQQNDFTNTHLRQVYTVARSSKTHPHRARRHECKRAFSRHVASAGTTTYRYRPTGNNRTL